MSKLSVTPLGDVLRALRGTDVIYQPNAGNAGDNIIAAATYQQFDLHGITTIPSRPGIDVGGRTVVYGGGGNLTKNYTNARDFILRSHSAAKQLIVLPHTIEGHADLLQALGSNVTLICRELTSYQYVRAAAPRADVVLSEDVALLLNPERLLAEARRWPTTVRGWLDLSSLTANEQRLQAALSRRPDATRLSCFRTDVESSGERSAAHNIDLSEVLRYRVYPRSTNARISAAFAKTLQSVEAVETDRLHVAIVAGVVGVRSIELSAGNYFKNFEVYNHSMRLRFPQMRFRMADGSFVDGPPHHGGSPT